MKRRIAWLMTGLAASVASAQSIDEGRSVASELYADAMERAQSRAAGAYTPKIGGFIASRYNINVRDGTPPDKDFTIGGQMAYTKLNVTGNAFSDAITYRVQFKFGEADGLAVLDDAYIDYKFENEFTLRGGQFKLPVLREENMSDTKQLSANRSVMNGVFTQSRSQGLMLTYAGQDVRVLGSFNDGIRTPNVDFVGPTEGDFGATVRGEFKWGGDWKQYDEFTSWIGSKFFGAVGAAIHYQEGGATGATGPTSATNNTDTLLGTIDVMSKGDGWNVYAAFVARTISGPTVADFADFGFLIQAGKFVAPQWELFARYDVVIPDSDRATDDAFNTITVGANRYISPDSHAVKLTLALLFFPNETTTGIVTQSTLAGVLTSSEKNQVAAQAQLQIAF
jgi:hypothetical protein